MGAITTAANAAYADGIRPPKAAIRDLFALVEAAAQGSGAVASAYGVDGVGDDTAALQAAIDANYGNTLVVDVPDVLISSPISLVKPIRLIGLGGGRNNSLNYGTRLHTTTGGLAQILKVNVTTGGGNEDFGGLVDGFILDGNSDAAIGLQITGSKSVKWRFNDINSMNNTNIGIDIASDHSMRFYNCQAALNGSNTAADAGWWFNGANSCTLFGCNAEANHGNGVIVQHGYDNAWYGGAIEGNTRHGVYGLGDGQHFTLQDIDFEGNGSLVAATYMDIDLSVTLAAYWNIWNCKFAGTDVLHAILNHGLQNNIRNVQCNDTPRVLWDSNAINGVFEGDVANVLDAASVLGPFVKVHNSEAKHLSTTTPAVGATGVKVFNPVLNGPVFAMIENVGSATTYTVTQESSGGTYTSNIHEGPVYLGPGDSISFAYAGAAPTWRWRAF